MSWRRWYNVPPKTCFLSTILHCASPGHWLYSFTSLVVFFSLSIKVPGLYLYLVHDCAVIQPFTVSYQIIVLSLDAVISGLQVDSSYIYIYIYIQDVPGGMCQTSGGVPYVKVHRHNPKHLYPKLNGYGDNGQRKVWSSCGSTYCTC
jgi:hypothetical protein